MVFCYGSLSRQGNKNSESGLTKEGTHYGILMNEEYAGGDLLCLQRYGGMRKYNVVQGSSAKAVGRKVVGGAFEMVCRAYIRQ